MFIGPCVLFVEWIEKFLLAGRKFCLVKHKVVADRATE